MGSVLIDAVTIAAGEDYTFENFALAGRVKKILMVIQTYEDVGDPTGLVMYILPKTTHPDSEVVYVATADTATVDSPPLSDPTVETLETVTPILLQPDSYTDLADLLFINSDESNDCVLTVLVEDD